MHDVFLRTEGIVAADSTRDCLAGIGGSRHFTDNLHRLETFPAAEDYRSSHHAAAEPRKKRFVLKMGIMYIKYRLVKLFHFEGNQFEPPFLET